VTIAIATSVTSTITSVSASASPNPVSNGSTTQISAVVLGTDSFDSSVTWVVVSGPGIIVGNVLTATGVGTIIAKATSIQDGTKNGSVSIVSTATVQNGVTGITGTATPSTIYVGQTSNIDVIVTGIGTFSTATNWIGPGLNIVGTGNSRIFTAASFPNTSFLQVVSIERPSIFVDIQIVTVLPSIISVTASALSNSIPNGSTTQVSAVVSGDGPFDPAVTWTIFSGPGTIAGDIVTATGVGTIVVKATSVQDVSKSATVSIVATATATNNTLIVNDVAWTSILEDDIYTVVRPASVTGPIYSVSLINNIQSALFQKYGLNLTYDSFFVDALIYYFFYE
jgi:endo-1,4-beta-xylanase